MLMASADAEAEDALGEAVAVVYVRVFPAGPQGQHSPGRGDREHSQWLASAGLACEFARACFHRWT